MSVPLGLSLRIALGVTDAVACASCGLILAAWEHWLGPQRAARKFALLADHGLIEPTDPHNLDRILRLTEQGRAFAAGGRDPNACWRRASDGRWRFALFDVPETERARRLALRRKLRQLHFGPLQQSVWLSPDPFSVIAHQLQGVKVDARTLLFVEGVPCAEETDMDLATVAWDFRKINRYYEDYLKVLEMYPRRDGLVARADWLETEWRAWLRAVRNDPFLPARLLPAGYRGQEAWARRQAVFEKLFRQA